MDTLPPTPAAVVMTDPCPATPFARGEDPAWTLADCGRHLLLEIAGVAPIPIAHATWRATPAGRLLSGTDPAGRIVTMRIAQANCTGAAGQRVVLTVGGRSLIGCLLARGDRPYGG